jgi:3-oxoacyl-[acyl-carrier protein] reductase
VCPGFITSRWFVDGLGQAAYDQLKARSEASTPLARATTPEDVAEAIVWLADGAHTVTGELIQLDAGMHLGTRAIPMPRR